MNAKKQIVCVSGAFDPLHVGHVRMLTGSAHFGELVVILNSDKWLIERKGYALMPWQERKDILLEIKGIQRVLAVDDSDGTVCSALEEIKPYLFANGGLRVKENTPERQLCERLGIKMVWGIGGGEQDDYTLRIRNRIYEIGIGLNKK